ncbi:arylsulfatase A-like enzyme [Puniceicoccus vermicola]
MRKDAITLAKCYRGAGYRTGYIGKWHLAGKDQGKGPVKEKYRGGYQDWLAANTVETTSGPFSTILWNEKNEPVRLPGYRVDAMTDAAIRYIDKRAAENEQPFMLCLSLLEPHHQNTNDSFPAPPGYEEFFTGRWTPPDLQALGGSSAQHIAGYYGMVKRVDEALGRLMDAVHSLGIANHTITAFVSDHGCHFKTRNAEYKRTPHESSVRIPLALWGTEFDGGGELREATGLINLPPSLLDACGIAPPDSMQALSILPLLKHQRRNWPKESYIQFGDNNVRTGRALRSDRWKYAVSIPKDTKPAPHAKVYEETHLYDLQADPYELRNLIEEEAYQTIRKHFRQRIRSWLKETNEPPAEIIPATTKPSGQLSIDYPCGEN